MLVVQYILEDVVLENMIILEYNSKKVGKMLIIVNTGFGFVEVRYMLFFLLSCNFEIFPKKNILKVTETTISNP